MDPKSDNVEAGPHEERRPIAPNPTLLWGGTLMTLAGLAALLLTLTRASTPALVQAVLFGASCLIFAYGFRGGGSVVGRSTWGRVGLTGLAVVVLAGDLIGLVGGAGGASQSLLLELAVVGGATGLCAIISAFVILRQAAVPRPWNWTPAIAVAAIEFTNLLAQGSLSGTQTLDLGTRWEISRSVTTIALIVYGVAALFLCRRVGHLESSPRPVVDPGETNLIRPSQRGRYR